MRSATVLVLLVLCSMTMAFPIVEVEAIVSNCIYDLIYFFENWTWTSFQLLFTNKWWFFISPIYGGFAYNEAFLAYNKNTSLYKFLGYTLFDVYMIAMYDAKTKYNTFLGVDNKNKRAAYTTQNFERPPM